MISSLDEGMQSPHLQCLLCLHSTNTPAMEDFWVIIIQNLSHKI